MQFAGGSRPAPTGAVGEYGCGGDLEVCRRPLSPLVRGGGFAVRRSRRGSAVFSPSVGCADSSLIRGGAWRALPAADEARTQSQSSEAIVIGRGGRLGGQLHHLSKNKWCLDRRARRRSGSGRNNGVGKPTNIISGTATGEPSFSLPQSSLRSDSSLIRGSLRCGAIRGVTATGEGFAGAGEIWKCGNNPPVTAMP